MSGTSLDGLDIALCEYTNTDKGYAFKLEECTTLDYSNEWVERLRFAHHLLPRDFALLNAEYGTFLGKTVAKFLRKVNRKADFVASHGHTIFHEPQKTFTTQIGSGAHIAAHSGLETICDFRTTDVALSGNGAPLVPIGDELLFGEYEFCLNLGGFANVSLSKDGVRKAFDICPANLVLNYLSKRKGFSFDEKGKLAASGKLIESLFSDLNALQFYQTQGPKSLGREWVESEILPLLANEKIETQDYLHTFCHHIAYQIAKNISTGRLLVTGGGAYNDFLIFCLKEYSSSKVDIILPDQQTIEFKEALIFGLLGVLRKTEQINVYASVTGATKNNIGGCIYLP